MKKFIKLIFSVSAAGVLLVFATIFLLDITLFENSETLSYQKINKFYSSNKQFTLGILGSSKAEGDYIPSIIDSDGYAQNFGLPGTGNKVWYYMLLDELKNSIPRKIVVNVDLTRQPIEQGPDFNYSYYLKLPKNSDLYAALKNTTKSELLPSPFFYFGSVKGFVAQGLQDKISLTSVIDRGFKGKTNSLSEVQFEAKLKDIDSLKVEFNSEIWKKTFDQIDASNDTVYFVLAPVYAEKFKRLDYYDFKKGIKQLLKSHPNIHFYDFSNTIDDKNLFYDLDHLNYEGAVYFSTMLRDSIQN